MCTTEQLRVIRSLGEIFGVYDPVAEDCALFAQSRGFSAFWSIEPYSRQPAVSLLVRANQVGLANAIEEVAIEEFAVRQRCYLLGTLVPLNAQARNELRWVLGQSCNLSEVVRVALLRSKANEAGEVPYTAKWKALAVDPRAEESMAKVDHVEE